LDIEVQNIAYQLRLWINVIRERELKRSVLDFFIWFGCSGGQLLRLRAAALALRAPPLQLEMAFL